MSIEAMNPVKWEIFSRLLISERLDMQLQFLDHFFIHVHRSTMEQSSVGVPTTKVYLAGATPHPQKIFLGSQLISDQDFRSQQSLYQVVKVARSAKQMPSNVGARTFTDNLELETLLFEEMNQEN